jgi:hypothetical protein
MYTVLSVKNSLISYATRYGLIGTDSDLNDGKSF